MVGNDDSSGQTIVSTWITHCQNQDLSNMSNVLSSPLSRQLSPLFGRQGVPRPGRHQAIGPDIRGRRGPKKMKHMTCPYWASGSCRYPEPDCLYAHQMIGTIADQPVRVEPGKLAVAEKNALSRRLTYINWRERTFSTKERNENVPEPEPLKSQPPATPSTRKVSPGMRRGHRRVISREILESHVRRSPTTRLARSLRESSVTHSLPNKRHSSPLKRRGSHRSQSRGSPTGAFTNTSEDQIHDHDIHPHHSTHDPRSLFAATCFYTPDSFFDPTFANMDAPENQAFQRNTPDPHHLTIHSLLATLAAINHHIRTLRMQLTPLMKHKRYLDEQMGPAKAAHMTDRIIEQVLDINHQVTQGRVKARETEQALCELGVTEILDDEEDERFEAEQEDKWGKGWDIRKGIDSHDFLTDEDWRGRSGDPNMIAKNESRDREKYQNRKW